MTTNVTRVRDTLETQAQTPHRRRATTTPQMEFKLQNNSTLELTTKMVQRKVSRHGTSAEFHRQRLPVGDCNSMTRTALSKTDSTNGLPEEFQAARRLGDQKTFNSQTAWSSDIHVGVVAMPRADSHVSLTLLSCISNCQFTQTILPSVLSVNDGSFILPILSQCKK